MKLNVLRSLLGALALLLALPLAAQPAKEIMVWYGFTGSEKAAFEKVVAAFNQANAGKVKVSTLAVAENTLAEKVASTVPGGKGPDVFIFGQDHLGTWAAAGHLVEPLDARLDATLRERYLPNALDAMTWQGKVYGLPLDFKTTLLFYNRKLMPVPPKTTAEMAPMAKRLTDAKAGKFGLAYSYADFYYQASLMNGFGGGVFGAHRPILNSAQNVAAFNLLRKWIDLGFLPPDPSPAAITALFNSGKAAMVISGPWFLPVIAKGVDFGVAPLPAIAELQNKPMRPWVIVDGVYLAAPGKNKDAAFAFARYLTDLPAARVLALEGRQMPASKGIYADPGVAADPILKAFRQQMDVAVPMPNVPEMAKVWAPAATAMSAVVKKTATPKAALDQAQKDVLNSLGIPDKPKTPAPKTPAPKTPAPKTPKKKPGTA
ncbi:MAG TPA: extracellular solute-binding protein [Thermoanaerobaculia bacterium]|nr:extracellular solute-binding protein [Thermoanaerobaculia bacterium]